MKDFMAHLWEANYLVESLYRNGSTSNKELQQLLILLKDISDSSPEDLREDFKTMFHDIHLSKSTLNDTRIMTMMFLTKIAMSYEPTHRGEYTQRLMKIHTALLAAEDEILRKGRQQLQDFYLARLEDKNEPNEKILNEFMNDLEKNLQVKTFEIRQIVEKWLSEINC